MLYGGAYNVSVFNHHHRTFFLQWIIIAHKASVVQFAENENNLSSLQMGCKSFNSYFLIS